VKHVKPIEEMRYKVLVRKEEINWEIRAQMEGKN
jgi:hypothetical protein